jgi:hypothetical protein
MRNDQQDAAKLEPHLRRLPAAKYVEDTYGIPCSPKTLAKYACVGGGPPFRLAGRFPLYPVSGLDGWAQSKMGPWSDRHPNCVASSNPPTPSENPAARLPGRNRRAHRA